MALSAGLVQNLLGKNEAGCVTAGSNNCLTMYLNPNPIQNVII